MRPLFPGPWRPSAVPTPSLTGSLRPHTCLQAPIAHRCLQSSPPPTRFVLLAEEEAEELRPGRPTWRRPGEPVVWSNPQSKVFQKTLSACFLFFSFQLSRPPGALTRDPYSNNATSGFSEPDLKHLNAG